MPRPKDLPFLTLLALVVLRTAIGWHFLYEGVVKLESHREGRKPWSAASYLSGSTGPFATEFRALANPDPYGLRRVDGEAIREAWKDQVERFSGHYALAASQERIADASCEEALQALKEYLEKDETKAKLDEFHQGVEAWIEESKREPLAHRRNELAWKQQQLVDLRAEIREPIDGIGDRLNQGLRGLLTPDQAERPLPPERVTLLDVADTITAWGLTLVGLCLMLGLFSRLAAVGAIGFLALFYLAMPPWPGLPPNPLAEGNYLIVSKNLVELLACLVLVTVPTGKWLGFDALITRRIRSRRRPAPAEPAEK
jgi:uncharacterized membrane protein YphA (DoxX/SURF4 family)